MPVLFNYDLDNKTVAEEWTRFLNKDMGQKMKQCSAPARFAGLGTLPMQYPELAAKELERLVLEDGLKGIQIGSHVNMPKSEKGSNGELGKNMYLYDKRLDPVWATAERLGAGTTLPPNTNSKQN